MQIRLSEDNSRLVLPCETIVAGEHPAIRMEHTLQLLEGLRSIQQMWSSTNRPPPVIDEKDGSELVLFTQQPQETDCSFCGASTDDPAVDLKYYATVGRHLTLVYCNRCAEDLTTTLDTFVTNNTGRLLGQTL